MSSVGAVVEVVPYFSWTAPLDDEANMFKCFQSIV